MYTSYAKMGFNNLMPSSYYYLYAKVSHKLFTVLFFVFLFFLFVFILFMDPLCTLLAHICQKHSYQQNIIYEIFTYFQTFFVVIKIQYSNVLTALVLGVRRWESNVQLLWKRYFSLSLSRCARQKLWRTQSLNNKPERKATTTESSWML